ncbi:MAG: ribulose-5-phosphate 4-epimerase/fuculose-1-phosphate aldolase [Lysobacterales bacterium]|jgi:ribulose-5-phosphate 4-epimerase/fuculose-1-phosphate aldolase
MTINPDNHASRYSQTEWQMRVDLAACYRLADMFGFSDIVWNHITAKVPGTECFLINRFGLRYDEVTASNLITVDLHGEIIDVGTGSSNDELDNKDINITGFVIHSAIHAARPDVHCVMHSHSSAGLAVSVLKSGLIPMVQDALPFHNRIAYHDYEGISMDPTERERLATSLGDNMSMILRNHGLLTCGATVGEAFMMMYYLERACKVQLQVLATGQEYSLPDDDLCEKASRQYAHFQPGKYEWPALLRLVEKQSPDFRD